MGSKQCSVVTVELTLRTMTLHGDFFLICFSHLCGRYSHGSVHVLDCVDKVDSLHISDIGHIDQSTSSIADGLYAIHDTFLLKYLDNTCTMLVI